MSRHIVIVALLAPLALAAYACGGTTTGGTSGSDGGPGADGSSGEAGSIGDGGSIADGGTDLFPADATKIVASSKGGFGPGLQDGSTCSPADTTYTLTLPARALTWKVCAMIDGGLFAYDTGTRTLSAADSAPVEAALHAIRVTTTQMCGADAPEQTVTFSTPAGDKVLYDDFYYCSEDGKTYVHGIGEVLTEFAKVAR